MTKHPDAQNVANVLDLDMANDVLRLLVDRFPDLAVMNAWPASEETALLVLQKPVTDDGRSDFMWIRLVTGDLVLGVYPRGDTYFEIEEAVDVDCRES